MEDEWRWIDGFSRYSIDRNGNIKNNETGRMMRASLNNHGVMKVGLISDETQAQTTKVVKNLVAETYLSKPEHVSMDTVIVKDGDNENMSVDNLAWRPRWFAHRYAKQFDTPGPWMMVKGLYEITEGRYYENMVEAAIDNGLLFKGILETIFNPERTAYPTGQQFAYEE